MYDNIVKLIATTSTIDDYGDKTDVETERTVFCDLRSIGQTEFYQAQALGLKPEIKFVLPDYLEYKNEQKLKFKPFDGEEEIYSVIRTYRANNELEIVCKRGID